MKKSTKAAVQLPPDAEARNIARFSLNQNLVVEAGAGTGKTTLLTDRILFLLLAGNRQALTRSGSSCEKGLPITRIVALTFTEKAAGEIKMRLSSKLADLSAVVDGRDLPEKRQREAEQRLEEAKERFGLTPEAVRRAAETALQEMDRAAICTLHSFALTLLRLFPVEAGLDPGLSVDSDESAFDELFDSEWATWLDEELAEGSSRAASWLELLPLASLEDLRDLARELCYERYAEARFLPDEERLARFRGDVGKFASIPDGKPLPTRGKILEAHATIAAHLRDLDAGLSSRCALPDRFHRPDFKSLAGLKWPTEWAGDVALQPIYESGAKFASRVSKDSQVIVRRSVELVMSFAERFRQEYRRRGHIGFDGLLIQARNLVRDNSDVRRELKKRFAAFLVDEFQDTDPLQGELVLYLSEMPDDFQGEWRKVRLEPGKIFVVGDPKQSIYRFRGADMRAYEEFTQKIIGEGGLKCTLSANFRSHDGILSPVNAAFASLMCYEKGLQPDYQPLIAARGPSPNGPSVHWVLSADTDEVKAEEAQEREARWVADWIRSHGTSSDPAEPGKHRFRDIAVLLHTVRPASFYLEAFKQAGIPYAVEIDRYFYGAQEVVDLVNLLRVLDDPGDEVAMLGLLRSPLGGLDDKEICCLKEAGDLGYVEDGTAVLDQKARLRVQGLHALLRRFRPRVGREPLGDFIGALFKDSFFVELCSEAYHREQTVSNLQKFSRLAANAGEARGETLKRFIARVTRLMDESAEEGESPLADERLNAVHILTIHKSKGLEYGAVFVPNLSGARSDRGRKHSGRVDWATGTAGFRLAGVDAADLSMAMIEAEEREREKRELVRLLYVGMTRAKNELYLLGRPDPSPGSFADILGQAGLWPSTGVAHLDVAGGRSRVYVAPAVQPSLHETKTNISRSLPLKKLTALWRRRFEERDKVSQAPLFDSPTRTAREPEKSVVPGPTGPSTAPAALVGQVCHRVLEQWPLGEDGTLPEVVEQACAELAAHNLLSDWEAVRHQSMELLLLFGESTAARTLAKADVLGREVPFVYAEEGRIVRGTIDLLFRDSEGLWVLDYKTDRISSSEISSRAMVYEAQGRSYQDAVRRTLGKTCGFKVLFLRTGDLVTVSPPC